MLGNGWGGARKGAGRIPLKENERKKGVHIYITDDTKKDIIIFGQGQSLSEKAVDLITTELEKRKMEDGAERV